MRVILIGLILAATVYADVSHLGYKYPPPTQKVKLALPPRPAPSALVVNNSPAEVKTPVQADLLAEQKTETTKAQIEEESEDNSAKINSQPIKYFDGYKYLVPKPADEKLTPVEPEPAHELTNNGYQYKTVRRIKHRYRL